MFIALVPAYNESGNIENVIKSLLPFVDRVVVIDDGSDDDTTKHAKSSGAVVLVHPINLGQGAALETGHIYARREGASGVIHFDGDGQFDPQDIIKAREILDSGEVDVVLGSRFLGNNPGVPWFKRFVILPLARHINHLFTGIKLSDAHNGFRAFSSKALKHIRITHNRMAHATEILSHIKKNNLTYTEIPVKVTYHRYGQGVSGGFAIIKDLITGKFIN